MIHELNTFRNKARLKYKRRQLTVLLEDFVCHELYEAILIELWVTHGNVASVRVQRLDGMLQLLLNLVTLKNVDDTEVEE